MEHWPSDARCSDAMISSRRPLGMGGLGSQQRERDLSSVAINFRGSTHLKESCLLAEDEVA